MKRQPPVQVLNTVCPVCGTEIVAGHPMVELVGGRKHERSWLVHVCSERCAATADRDPEAHVEAARESRTA